LPSARARRARRRRRPDEQRDELAPSCSFDDCVGASEQRRRDVEKD